jgi:hypothetical protein
MPPALSGHPVSHPASPGIPTEPNYIRVHITPLDADLLQVVLPTSIRANARNISYHNLVAFPEKRYGFLDVPVEDAERIKQRLNGAILRGVKVRVENARPFEMPKVLGEAALADPSTASKKEKKNKDKSKKRKRGGDEEIEGVELPEGRKVKRGWTVSPEEMKEKKAKEVNEKKERKQAKDKSRDKEKDKKEKKRAKKDVKSKYTDHPECLMKTILPANAVSAGPEGDGSTKKKKHRKSREVVIHEFENTTKFPTFLKASISSTTDRKPATEFVDGKGWVDEDGNVVEAVKQRPGIVSRTRSKQPEPSAEKEEGQDSGKAVDEDEDSGDDSDSGGSSEEKEEKEDKEEAAPLETPLRKKLSTSKLKVEMPSPAGLSAATNLSSPLLSRVEPSRPKSSDSPKNLTIKIPPVTPSAPKVHPLEALYKRPQPTDGTPSQPAKEVSSFSFFDNDADVDDTEGGNDNDTLPGSQVPMTPFTQQDFDTRGIRSAAPTPDTAHPSRRFRPFVHDDEDDIEEEDEEDENSVEEPEDEDMPDVPAAAKGDDAEAPADESTSDFHKWFYEHRRDINKSWRQRRKTVAKEKRYRDNRARAERAI